MDKTISRSQVSQADDKKNENTAVSKFVRNHDSPGLQRAITSLHLYAPTLPPDPGSTFHDFIVRAKYKGTNLDFYTP